MALPARIEAPVRNITGVPETAWNDVRRWRTEYEARTDARLTLDTSVGTPEYLLAEALNFMR